MRHAFLAAFAAIFTCMACNNEADVAGETKETSKADKNLAAFRTIVKAFGDGDVSGIDSVVATDFVDHRPEGDVNGADSLKALMKKVAGMKDMKRENLREVADDEYVFGWARYHGSTDGSMGMPAGPFEMHGIDIVRFRDGRAVEHWDYSSTREMMQMIQVTQPRQPGDTAAKR